MAKAGLSLRCLKPERRSEFLYTDKAKSIIPEKLYKRESLYRPKSKYYIEVKNQKGNMGILVNCGKVEYVNLESIHRMSTEQAIAFLKFAEASIKTHERAISKLHSAIEHVKEAHWLVKSNTTGKYEKETVELI